MFKIGTVKMPNETAEQRFQQLELLLNGLAELGTINEPLIDQAYTIALQSISQPDHLKILAEALRKKWLSEPDFPPVAVRICKKLSHLRIDDVRFSNTIYGHVVIDYRDRAHLRKISRTLFCNSTHFAFEFFRHFHVLEGGEENLIRHQKSQPKTVDSAYASRSSLTTVKSMTRSHGASGDAESSGAGNKRDLPHVLALGADDHVYVGFIDPLFEYLQMLIDDLATEHEMGLFHYLIFLLGPYLDRRKPAKMLGLMSSVRRKIIDSELRPSTRALLMEIIEISSHNWKLNQISTTTASFYLKYRPAPYSIGVAINENKEESEEDSESS